MIKYIQLVIIILTTAVVGYAFSPKEIIKKGTKLIYDVRRDGGSYTLEVEVKNNTKDLFLDWQINGPAKLNGSLNLNYKLIDSADGIANYFSDNTSDNNNLCNVVLSKKMFNALNKNEAIEIYTDKKNDIKSVFGNAILLTQTIGYNTNFSNELNCKTVTNGDNYQITYLNDADFPLIVEMQLDWYMRLRTIENR
jgi:hypothetical protein